MRRSLLYILPFCLAAPAFALTPEELWSTWQAQAEAFGETLQADAVTEADGTLTLRNWTRIPESGVPITLPADYPIQGFRLVPKPDGSVSIELVGLPESFTIPGGAETFGDLFLRHRGLAFSARDGADTIEYEIAVESLQAASVAYPTAADRGSIAFELQGFRLRFPGGIGADRQVSASLSLSGGAYVSDIGSSDIAAEGNHSARTTGDMTLSVSATLPEGIDWENLTGSDFVRALDEGLALQVEFEAGEVVQSAWFEGIPFSYNSDSTSRPGHSQLVLGRDGLALDAQFGGGSFTLNFPDTELPPIGASYGPMEGEFRVPLGAEAGELRYRASIEDIVIGEEAWALVDPQGHLPHDPIRLMLDLNGQMGLDLAAIVAAGEDGVPPPLPRIDSLELSAFEFAGAGLALAASGSLTYPNGDLNAPPTGSGAVRIEGLDRLLDTLVSVGLMTESDASSARLGLAAVFRPGGAPDTREATFELRADGSVWANGVQVQ